VIVHQAIETIEFVLGGIAHTASYLRLWALSLAHSQLAKVFFKMTIGAGIAGENFFKVAFGFYAFAGITLAVLMLMDSMECFLHALRLHW
jgi:V-type H+-transporting ATPase subunit a